MATVHAVTANRLADGRSVYLTAGRRWSEQLADAHTTASEQGQAEALAWARKDERHVCDPYVVKALDEGRGIDPASARERIRAAGPAWIRERFGYDV